MKYKNILITGARNCGKSTLINNMLEDLNLDYAGYRTLPYYINGYEQGYYIHGYLDGVRKEKLYSPISIKISGNRCLSVIETFETLGVYILRESRRNKNTSFILLDEIGFLEEESEKFKEEIHKCLDSTKFCLGVLKLKESKFLNSIKFREDTLFINIEDISYKDRKFIKDEIENYINLYRLKGDK